MADGDTNPNQTIFDQTVRHRIALERYSTDASKQTLGYLEDLKTDLAQLIVKATPGRRAQLQRLLEDAQELHGAVYQKITKSLSLQFKSVASKEAEWQGIKARAAGIEATFTRITADAAYAAATQRPMDGVLLQDWMRDLGPKARGRLERALRLSWTEGESIGAVLRRANDVVDLNGRAAKALIRTSNAHISAAVQQASFEANEDLIEELEWRSVLDSRTTPICQSRDGQRYPVNAGPRPPAHISCRSIVVEVLKGFPPPKRETYAEWIKRQSAETQDEILGPARGKLLREGALDVQSFVDERGKRLTLSELGNISGSSEDIAKIATAAKIKIGQTLTSASKAANGKYLAQMIQEFDGSASQSLVIDGFIKSPEIFGLAKFKALKKEWLSVKATPIAPTFPAFDAKKLGLPQVPSGTVASATKAANAKKVTAFFETKIKNNQWQALGKLPAIEAADHVLALAKAGAFSKAKAAELAQAAAKLKSKAFGMPAGSFASAVSAPLKNKPGRPTPNVPLDRDIAELLSTPGLPASIRNADRTDLEALWRSHIQYSYGGRNAPELSNFEEQIIYSYTGSSYGPVNSDLRSGSPSKTSKLFADIIGFALGRISSAAPPTTLYRGVGTARMNRWEQALRSADPGTDVYLRYDGVNSFSDKVTTATAFGARGGSINGQRVRGFMWVVKGVKAPKNIAKISAHKRENEWLYADGSMFKVQKVEIKKGGEFDNFAVVTVREVARVPKSATIEAAKVAGRPTPKTTAAGLATVNRTPRGDLRTARQEAVDQMLRKQVATGFEHAAVVGEGGRILWSGTSGARGSVRIRGLDKAAKGERVEIHHTHPADQSLSLEDLLLTNRNGRENVWVYAHSAAGGRFKARALQDLEGIADRVDMSGSIAQQALLKRLPSISADENQGLSWHIIMLALKRSGRIEYAASLSPRQAAMVASIGRQGMDDVVSDVARFIGAP